MTADSFALANTGDIPEIAALYRSLIGTPGCTWDEEYPNAESAHEDIERRSLYILRRGDKIIAAASAGAFGELSHLPWTPQNPCELARIGVSLQLHGHGIATTILQNVITATKQRGFDGIVLLASKTNPAALALYEKNGFTRWGEVYMWEHNFYGYQKVF